MFNKDKYAALPEKIFKHLSRQIRTVESHQAVFIVDAPRVSAVTEGDVLPGGKYPIRCVAIEQDQPAVSVELDTVDRPVQGRFRRAIAGQSQRQAAQVIALVVFGSRLDPSGGYELADDHREQGQKPDDQQQGNSGL